MNKLQKYSTSELIGELRKRKEAQLFHGAFMPILKYEQIWPRKYEASK